MSLFQTLSGRADSQPDELAQLEAVIDVGLAHFHAVGRAMKAIKERRLYAPKYASFGEYTTARWGLSLPHVTRLIEASDIVDQLVAAGSMRLPKIESHARVLSRITPEKRPEVWNAAIDAVGDTTTAEELDAVVSKLVPRTPKRGRKVPKAIRKKGKGGSLVLERKSHDVDAVAVLETVLSELRSNATSKVA
jgi:hypothetical protein